MDRARVLIVVGKSVHKRKRRPGDWWPTYDKTLYKQWPSVRTALADCDCDAGALQPMVGMVLGLVL
eukprot:3108775-Lingulodinium_polyedra.AAC.1